MRAKGFYWVLGPGGLWTIAEWDGGQWYSINGDNQLIDDSYWKRIAADPIPGSTITGAGDYTFTAYKLGAADQLNRLGRWIQHLAQCQLNETVWKENAPPRQCTCGLSAALGDNLPLEWISPKQGKTWRYEHAKLQELRLILEDLLQCADQVRNAAKCLEPADEPQH